MYKVDQTDQSNDIKEKEFGAQVEFILDSKPHEVKCTHRPPIVFGYTSLLVS